MSGVTRSPREMVEQWVPHRWPEAPWWKVGNGPMLVAVVRADRDGWVFQANLKKFMEYVQLHSTDKVARLLDKGLDPNFHDPDSGGEKQHRKGHGLGVARIVTFVCPLNPECPLSLAAQLDDAADLLKVLRNGGAHLDFRTRDGLTAVHCATRQRNAAALTVSAGGAAAWRGTWPCSGERGRRQAWRGS